MRRSLVSSLKTLDEHTAEHSLGFSNVVGPSLREILNLECLVLMAFAIRTALCSQATGKCSNICGSTGSSGPHAVGAPSPGQVPVVSGSLTETGIQKGSGTSSGMWSGFGVYGGLGRFMPGWLWSLSESELLVLREVRATLV